MSRAVIDRRSHRRLHAFLLSIAAALGVLAVCLIVFGSTPRQLKLGAIVGLWAALIAAFQAPAFRRPTVEPAAPVDLGPVTELLDQHRDSQLAATKQVIDAQSGELRRAGELQMARDSAARREADVNLQLAIRHEIERTMVDQFGVLRQEVSSLRAEVFDKLGGQIKLERIETTRLIGSDLEALQNQIRRLAEDREQRTWSATDSPHAGDVGATNGQPSTGRRTAGIVDAEVVDSAPTGAAGSAAPQSPAPPAVPSARTVTPPAEVPPAPGATPVSKVPVSKVPVSKVPVSKVPLSKMPVSEAPLSKVPVSKLPPVRPGTPAPSPGPAALRPDLVDSAPREDAAPDSAAWSASRPVRSKSAEMTAAPGQPSDDGDQQAPSTPPKGRDPFADLPRLTPIPPEVLEPLPVSERSGRRRAPEDDPDSPHYVGRRRPDVPGSEPPPDPQGENSGRRRAPGHASD